MSLNIEVNKFSTGDFVFAKVKGYPPWPARIDKLSSSSSSSPRYEVVFYGTHQTSVCKDSDIFPFEENREKLGNKKQQGFLAAMEEIENSIKHTDDATMKNQGTPQGPDRESTAEAQATKGETHKTLASPSVSNESMMENIKISMFPVIRLKDCMKQKDAGSKGDEKAKQKETPVGIRSSVDANPGTSENDSNLDLKKSPSKSTRKTSSLLGKTPIVALRLRQEPVESAVDNHFMSGSENKEEYQPNGYPHTEPREGDEELIFFEEITASIANKASNRTSFSSASDCSLAEENLISKMIKARPCCTHTIQEKLRFLETEQKLIKAGNDLRRCLGPATSTINVEVALSVLSDLESTELNALVLKKQPIFVDIIHKLCRFVGPVDRTPAASLVDSLAQIREKASKIFHNIRACFTIPEDENFCERFKREAMQLRMLVPSGNRFMLLTEELTVLEIGPVDDSCC